MNVEVEQKFRDPDVGRLRSRLTALDAVTLPRLTQCDTYFAHPVRDFAETDEAFRIRRIDDENRVTYKGPRLDGPTKTRRELEVAIASGSAAADRFAELLVALGFRPVAVVDKVREPYRLSVGRASVECVIDTVHELGIFAEVEIVTDEGGVESARTLLLETADRLGLLPESVERRSYLQLLLERGRSDFEASA